MRDQTSWGEAVTRFLTVAVDSENTRRSYAMALRRAERCFGGRPLRALDLDDLARYRAGLLSSDLAPNTVSVRLAGLRSFLSWAGVMELHALPRESVRLALRIPAGDLRRPYQVLSEPEIARVLAGVEEPRDRAMVAVLLGGGLRVSELVALDVRDLIEEGNGELLLHVAHGKGGRSRTVPVRADVGELVRRYLALSGRRLGDDGPLFLARDPGAGRRSGRGLSPRAIGYLVHRLANDAGVVAKRISPHSLRHTYALRALRYSGNVVAVSKLLGHAQIATTQRYVDHLELSDLRRSVPALVANDVYAAVTGCPPPGTYLWGASSQVSGSDLNVDQRWS
jgi:integrase